MNYPFTKPRGTLEKQFSFSRRSHTLKLIMRISYLNILLLIASLQVLVATPAYVNGQTIEKITVKMEFQDAPLKRVFQEIEKQTEFRFLTAAERVNRYSGIDLPAGTYTVKEVLEHVLVGTALKYEQRQNHILVFFTEERIREMLETSEPGVAGLEKQAVAIAGTVRDDRTQKPLPGVNVLVKGTTMGTVTDNEGNYVLEVSELTGTLVFSYIGYTTIEVPVSSRTTIDITMAEDVTNLDEVVVTAMGIPRQARSLTYSTQKVSGEQLNEVRTPNIVNSLSGRVAGMVVSSSAFGPGSSVKILLRGNRSIAGDNGALIVVDGAIIGSDGISTISPDDVESINVLKGSAATALYGTTGANGVILITTKRGRSGKLSVSVNSGATHDTPLLSPKVQNEFAQGNGGVFGAASPNSWGPQIAGQQVTDWTGKQTTLTPQPDNLKGFFKNALSLNNAIAISGGTDITQTYFSYANVYSEGLVPLNKLNRHTVNLRINSNLGKRFSTDAKVNFVHQDIAHVPDVAYGAPMNIYRIPRTIRLEDVKNYESVDATGATRPNFWYVDPFYGNPYWYVNNTRSDDRTDRITGLISGKFQVADWLDVKAIVSLDLSNDKGSYQADNNTPGAAGSDNGSFGYDLVRRVQRNIDVLVSGKNNLSRNLKISYNLGGTVLDTRGDVTGISVRKLIVPNRFNLAFAAQADQFNRNSNTHIQRQAIFATAQLSFKDYLYLDGSARQEYFSTLPAPYYSFYPSVGLGVILSDMIKMPSIVNYAKARVGYARTGGGGPPFLNKQTYTIYPNGIQRDVVSPFPDLKPELTTGWEAGTEWRFFENRLNLDVTWYKSNTTNQLLRVPTPPGTGFQSQYINAGDIQNSVIEVVLNVTPLNRALTWDVGVNFARNKNKVLEVLPTQDQVQLDQSFTDFVISVAKVGGAFGDLYAYGWKRNAAGEFIVDANGRPQRTDGIIKIGNYNPDFTLGVDNSFTYKNFVFNFLVDSRFGGEMISATDAFMAFDGTAPYTTSHREPGSWLLPAVYEEGSANNTPINAETFWTTVGGRNPWSEEFIYDATNVRLKELAIGYRFTKLPVSFIKDAKLSLVARNVFFFYRGYAKVDLPGVPKRKANFDSEVNLYNSNLQGLEYGTLPPTRSIGLNLKLSL
jgi:TonB-linked SusC/RagA family outer membrane protein